MPYINSTTRNGELEMTNEQENLTKALHTAQFLVQDLVDLQATNNKALSVLVDQLITKAAEIRNTLNLLETK